MDGDDRCELCLTDDDGVLQLTRMTTQWFAHTGQNTLLRLDARREAVEAGKKRWVCCGCGYFVSKHGKTARHATNCERAAAFVEWRSARLGDAGSGDRGGNGGGGAVAAVGCVGDGEVVEQHDHDAGHDAADEWWQQLGAAVHAEHALDDQHVPGADEVGAEGVVRYVMDIVPQDDGHAAGNADPGGQAARERIWVPRSDVLLGVSLLLNLKGRLVDHS